MSPENDNGSGSAVGPQSHSDKVKAPGRVENMRRINREGLAGRGGRPPEHGEYALAARYKAGLSEQNPMYPLIKKHRDDFVADLGGEENASAKEREACEHMAFLAFLHRIQVSRFGLAKRMNRQELLELSQAATRTAATFAQIAKQLGFKRQLKDLDRTVVVKRWTVEPAPATPDNDTKQGGGQ